MVLGFVRAKSHELFHILKNMEFHSICNNNFTDKKMTTKRVLIILACLIVSLGFVACSSNPVAEVSIIEDNPDNHLKNTNKSNNISEIAEPTRTYKQDGCLFKEWDRDHGNPVGCTWASWLLMYIDDYDGENYQCSDFGADCIEWSWRAVYCGIIAPIDNPTPGNTCNVDYIQTLMDDAGQAFVGDISDWSYNEVYVQPGGVFPVGTSQIDIDFLDWLEANGVGN